MSKKTRDLKPDTVLKNYWSNNEQFADLFNAVLFKGRQIIKPEELEEVDAEESSVLEHRDYAESMKASRDVIKVQKQSSVHGMRLNLLGLENQEHIHYAMPMRVMGYDYGSYKKQYDSNAKKYKTADGMNEDEYLSGMKQTDKFLPVITVVVYYGEKPWDGAKSLHEMLHISPDIQTYVNDYRMLLVEARKNHLTLHSMNNIDLFALLDILLNKDGTIKETRNRAIKYVEEHKVDKSVIMTAAGATNCRIDYNELDRRGDADMCTVFEETWKEGVEVGRSEGISCTIDVLRDLGHEDAEIKSVIMKKYGLSEEEMKKYL